MKQGKSKAFALIVSACLLFIAAQSISQSKTQGISPKPAEKAVTKGYYSIYNNAEKLSNSRGKKAFVNRNRNSSKQVNRIFSTAKKGYYAIGSNEERRRNEIAVDTSDLFSETSADIIKYPIMPEIKKGYYSIGNNAQKLME